MAAAGESAAAIALKLGTTPGSVRVKCSQLQIKLRVGRGRELKSTLVLELLPEQVEPLKVAAVGLGITPGQLARRIVSVVLSNDLVKAVLDE